MIPRRGFFALLLAPLLSRLLPAKAKAPALVATDPKTGIAIRFVKAFDIQANVQGHRLAFHPDAFALAMDPLDVDTAYRLVNEQKLREFDALVKDGRTDAARQFANDWYMDPEPHVIQGRGWLRSEPGGLKTGDTITIEGVYTENPRTGETDADYWYRMMSVPHTPPMACRIKG